MSVAKTADRVAEAARAILETEGVEAVTMRRVADAVGITAMAIYKHYPNREALLAAVADRALRELGAGWGGRDGDWEARALGLLDDFLDFALGSPHLYRFLITDRRERARRFPDGFRDGASPSFTKIVTLAEEGMRASLLRPDDPLEVAMTVTATAQGLVQLYLGGRIGLAEDEFRALCTRATRRVLDGVRA
ncbi:TetR/AcrR family transcriptional regulator [Nonomuraea ferruginea]